MNKFIQTSAGYITQVSAGRTREHGASESFSRFDTTEEEAFSVNYVLIIISNDQRVV